MSVDIPFTPVQFVTIGLVAFIGGLVRGFGGFGTALIITPVLSVVVGPQAAVPAVTLALAAFRKFPLRKVPRYVAAQCLGSVVASALTAFSWRGVASGPVLDAFPFIMRFSPGVSVPAGAFVEMWQTAVLAYAIFTLTGPRHAASVPKGSPPFIIGGVLAALITLGGPLTGAGFNPARDLGPRVVAALAGAGKLAFPTGWWAYTVGPVLGGLAGAAFAVTVTKSEEAVALTQFPNPDISPEDTAL